MRALIDGINLPGNIFRIERVSSQCESFGVFLNYQPLQMTLIKKKQINDRNFLKTLK